MDDLIKKSDAINELEDMRGYRDEDGYVMIFKSDAIDRINCITTTDRPRGHWVDTGKVYFGAKVYACSVCGEECDEMPTCMGKPMWKYCPYCSADMRGESDGRG
jgi:hypothetical protein